MEADESGDVDLGGMDGLDGIPNEVLFLILELLDLESLLVCHDVCQSWRKYALVESTFLPHVLRTYANLTHGTRPLPAGVGGPEVIGRLKELFRTSVSALPVFAGCTTLRDLAVRLHRLDKSWLSGRNTGYRSLGHNIVHQAPLVSVAVDVKTGGIVTGDSDGVLAFWDAATGALRYKENWAFTLHIVVEGNLMVVGTAIGTVVIATRNRSGVGAPFTPVAQFWPNSGHIISMRMEGYICIVGEVGAVSFWDLSHFAILAPTYPPTEGKLNVPILMNIDTRNDSTPMDASPNYSLFYRDGLLFVGLTGSRIQQIASHASREMPVRKELWEPHEESHYAVLVSGPEIDDSLGGVGFSQLCPIGCDGDILVSWADSSIYRLSSNTAVGDDFVWEPRSRSLIPPAGGAHDQSLGICARGDQVICRFKPQEIEMFSAEGSLLGRISTSPHDISCMTVDPAFIVVGTTNGQVFVYYFAPVHRTPAYSTHGQGPSSSAAITAAPVVRSLLERKNTYKRKYLEAMGPDIPENPVGSSAAGSSDFEHRMAKNVPRGPSSPLVLGSTTDHYEVPVVSSSPSTIPDRHLLFLALADSYLNTAHSTGIKESFDGSLYQTLVTAAIRCLEAALYQCKLQPKFEAALRLRYASVLEEETENMTDAEQILHKGNNFQDLKFAMQHLLVRIMYRMKPKAAFILLSQQIKETEVLSIAFWTYSFRFLLSSLRTQRTDEQDDNAAVSSLRSAADLAKKRDDVHVYALANLMEASILLAQGVVGVDAAKKALTRAQNVPLQGVPQLVFLYQMLDIMWATIQGSAILETEAKMKLLQENLDGNVPWKLWPADGTFGISVKPSSDRGGSEELRFRWLPKADLWALVWFLSGMIRTHSNGLDQKSEACLGRGLEMVEGLLSGNADPGLYSVETAAARITWRKVLKLSITLQLVYCYAARSAWDEAITTLRQVEAQFSGIEDETQQKFIKPWLIYTTAIVRHGAGNLSRALTTYQSLFSDRTSEIGILATLNSALILYGPRMRDLKQARDLLGSVTDFASNHRNPVIQAVFNVVKVALEKPGERLNEVRGMLSTSNRIFRQAGTHHMLTMTLALVCAKIFNPDPHHHVNMSRATADCAVKSGDRLWQALTKTMYADALVRGNRESEAKSFRTAGEQDRAFVEEYGQLKNRVAAYRSRQGRHLSSVDYLLTSGAAGVASAALTNPIWVVKTRMLTSGPGSPGAYRGLAEGLYRITVDEGLRGLFRGFLPSLFGVLQAAIQFMALGPNLVRVLPATCITFVVYENVRRVA
ncbi:hypothetical protein Dda_0851 [Drechslerella dactyloides]|uniref:F-box domain-containing protein n=1 Tax=Drechslerella dactyloides TaxID=74499 RepID=A0AAD6NMF0_DREDA|nr:hypothetical protein Dda_0851 [Drechslerella dactyloides]